MSTQSPFSLQAIILKLQAYWAEQGCLIWQPYHTEVGAGTMNPATFLRVLGPEPWRVAYVEPSFRPADGRYGENPNRWQHYYQFQVILKPDPGNPQELYLDSLVSLGIDPAKHDIRFVEDNWEAPPLGAWGLGWEVWLDGQEITQYTYFQQAGGQSLDPVSVEITYGLERIGLALQGVESFVELEWSQPLTYGDVKVDSEIEYCRYNFELADVDRLRRLYDIYEAEAMAAMEAGLIQPAYDYVLKCSHTFNLMDARGAVGVAERAALFGRMRALSTRVAEAYLEYRQRGEYPWLDKWDGRVQRASASEPMGEPPGEAADLLLEVGTEELPPDDLSDALEQLESRLPALLDEYRLEHGDVHVLGTPRRLVVHVQDVAPSQTEEVELLKGPPADRAFDERGVPTSAAEGFARSKGVPVEALRVESLDGGRYVVAEVSQPGQSSGQVLADMLPQVLSELSFKRSMRWNHTGVSFSRPVRWLLALHGSHRLPLEYAGVKAAARTRGLRFQDPAELEVRSPELYFNALENEGILLDVSVRRRAIWDQVSQLAGEVGGQVQEDPDLLHEVTHLVERPTALRGSFDHSFLSLPKPVLVTVMKEHQRYFPVEKDGDLLPFFIAVRNGGRQHLDTVISGNERVLRARFADADFFVTRDLERPLEAYVAKLDRLTFESQLGSMKDKVERLVKLVDELGPALGLEGQQLSTARRAAYLAKADLATQMVIEMTSLHGQMGRIYALRSGESEAVARAIEEHTWPRASGGEIPRSPEGFAVGVADRLDSLAGLFAAGMQPAGGGDPFGLRRAAIGLVESLVAHQRRLDLHWALAEAASLQPIQLGQDGLEACLEFIRRRHQALLLADGHRHDVIEAILEVQGYDPAAAAESVQALSRWVKKSDWQLILDSFARCARITRDVEIDRPLKPAEFEEEAERELYAAYVEATERERPQGSLDAFFEAFVPMIPAITAFFEDVLVMADDRALRMNRLALLQNIVDMAEGVVDLSKLDGF